MIELNKNEVLAVSGGVFGDNVCRDFAYVAGLTVAVTAAFYVAEEVIGFICFMPIAIIMGLSGPSNKKPSAEETASLKAAVENSKKKNGYHRP